MEKCYKSTKSLFGEDYCSKIQFYKDFIIKFSQKHKKEILESLIDICHLPEVEGDGFATTFFMAAAFDLIEIEKKEL